MSERASFRPEIQGLRAIAVLSVVLFHIWPDLVPGGYVGVDVFFVISGYLITSMLFRELQSEGSISLLRFYERRVRRLLPAATFVLLAILVAMPLLLPASRWVETAAGVVASALYVENWRLAWLAVDYLGAENVPSPVQHYWSLSVEEQFYIVWPLLMMGAGALAAKIGRLRTAVLASMAAIIAASFISSVWITARSSETAYFVTHTRMWELGVGAMLALAVLPDFSLRTREMMRLGGLAAIVTACFAFSTKTAFPGYAALLPTLGCALIIAAGSKSGRVSVQRLLELPPAQYLGDISYSVYLWHWPIIIFFLSYRPGAIPVFEGAGILAASIVLSHLSKTYIEDPFRHPRPGKALRTVGYGVVSIAACVTVSGLFIAAASYQGAAGEPEQYPGAAALLHKAPIPKVDAPIPALSGLKGDLPAAYKDKCHLRPDVTDPKPCVFGDPEAQFHVALVGDSHAASWIPALDEAGKVRRWRVTSHTKSGCALSKEMLTIRGKPYTACKKWGEQTIANLLADRPDIIIMTQSSGARIYGSAGERDPEAAANSIMSLWADFRAAGIKVVAVRDTPRLPFDPGECLSKNPGCTVNRKEHDVFPLADPLILAAGEMGVPLIDMTDALCTDKECPMVIGNVVVWRDWHHTTATYSRTLADVFADRVERAINAAAGRKAAY